MSILLDPGKSFVRITIWYVEERCSTGNIIFHFINEDTHYKFPKENMQSLNTVWKQMTWNEHNICLSSSTSRSGIDYYLYRDLKLKNCLKEWNLEDEQSNLIPCIPENIDNLYPVVADYLLRVYEKECELSSKDLEMLRRKARQFLEGKPTKDVPQYILEHILCYYYGWHCQDIRKMDYRDVMAHVQLCLTSDGLDKEFEIQLTGVDLSKPKHISAEKVLRGGDPRIKQY